MSPPLTAFPPARSRPTTSPPSPSPPLQWWQQLPPRIARTRGRPRRECLVLGPACGVQSHLAGPTCRALTQRSKRLSRIGLSTPGAPHSGRRLPGAPAEWTKWSCGHSVLRLTGTRRCSWASRRDGLPVWPVLAPQRCPASWGAALTPAPLPTRRCTAASSTPTAKSKVSAQQSLPRQARRTSSPRRSCSTHPSALWARTCG